MSQFLSIELNLGGRYCLVVGAGNVASRRAGVLLEAEAIVTVVAPRVSARIDQLSASSSLTAVRREFQPADLDGMFLAVAATNDSSVNRRVVALARDHGILVNSVDDPTSGDILFPSVVRRGAIQVAIATGGQVPALSRHLRGRIDKAIPEEYALLVEVLADLRRELRRTGARIEPETWQRAIDDELVALIRDGKIEEATRLARSRLGGAP
jgi:siroheme synthase-like protein